MDADWDLHAVVRGCCSAVPSSSSASATTNATVTTTDPTGPPDGYIQQKSTLYAQNFNGFVRDLFKNNLYNYNPLQFPNQEQTAPSSSSPPPAQSFQILPFSLVGGHQDPPYHHRQQDVKQQSLGISRCTTGHAQGTTKIKKRKNQIKKVCQVPDGSSPDLWSWRKYGQKPIKGSPYPRGYYKCSTLKGCFARKHVERNRSDPGMLIITYTGEHSHPMPAQVNSLAGSTRNKTTAITAAGDDDNENKTTPTEPEKTDEIERDGTDDDYNFEVSGLVIDEDTFDGLDELVGSDVGDMFSDHHAPSNTAPVFPWLSNNLVNTTTTAAGGS